MRAPTSASASASAAASASASASRSVAVAVAAALLLGACTGGGETVVDPVESSSPTASATEASPSPSPEPSASAPGFVMPPLDGRNPGGQPAPTGDTPVAALDAITPEEFATGLVAIDTVNGTVAWFDGLGWQVFDVDAALDAVGWATDDLGGVLLQSFDRAVWHLEPQTDEPTLVLPAPRDDFAIVQRLVGGGWFAGARQAYVELGMTRDPESASTDLVAIDIDDGQEIVLVQGIAGWESGVDQADIEDDRLVVTMYAEAFGIAYVQDLVANTVTDLVEDEFVTILTTVDTPEFGPLSAWALVEQEAGPSVLLRRELDESGGTRVENLPEHDAPWVTFTSLAGRQVVGALDGVAIARSDPFGEWRRLEPGITLGGVLQIAPGFALG